MTTLKEPHERLDEIEKRIHLCEVNIDVLSRDIKDILDRISAIYLNIELIHHKDDGK